MPGRRQTGERTEDRKLLLGEWEELRLLAAIRGEDRRAFEIFYRLYFPRLTRFLDRLLRSTDLIEEVINDTMWVVWRSAGRFDQSCRVSTWVFAIAYRKALKALGSRDLPVEADPDLWPAETCLQPEVELSQRQLCAQVGQALDALPLEQRTVVILVYYHGLRQEEIATIMDCPVNTVKSRMFHARRRLKSLLGDPLEGGS